MQQDPELQKRIDRLTAEEISIVPYDPAWPRSFAQEHAHLVACLPTDLVKRVEHFGSTAIPGLAAKPIVDLIVEVTDLEATKTRIASVLEAQGYDYLWRPTKGDDVPPFYAWFIKRHPGSGMRTHHIHMVEGNPDNPGRFEEHWSSLLFRDYLIERADLAREYEALKRRLAAQHPNDRTAYTDGKGPFIKRVTAEAKRYYGL